MFVGEGWLLRQALGLIAGVEWDETGQRADMIASRDLRQLIRNTLCTLWYVYIYGLNKSVPNIWLVKAN